MVDDKKLSLTREAHSGMAAIFYCDYHGKNCFNEDKL
jgi:hypothetical protein